VVHVPREAADDVGGGVVGEHRPPGGVEDVEYIVHGFKHVAVADTERLVGRLNRELIPAVRIALLIKVQAFKPHVEDRVRRGLLATVHGDAVAAPFDRLWSPVCGDDVPPMAIERVTGPCADGVRNHSRLR